MSTDDLLDEATRLADEGAYDTADTLRALVERVQQAEAERDDLALLVSEHRDALGRKHAYQQSVEAERDAAWGKLDKVRQWSDNNLGGAQNAALLAILDDKEG